MSETSSGSADQPRLARPNFPVRMMNFISRLCLILAGIALMVIVVINGVNVFCRYVLFWALSWAEESMVFLMIAGVFIGAITVTWENLHIRIEAFLNMLHGGWRVFAEWLAVLITACVLLPIGWVSWGVVTKLYNFDQRSDALNLPVWIPQVTIPFALLSIPVVMALVLILRRGDTNSTG